MEKLQKQLIILCGIPGSGKSTWIKNHLASFSGYTKVVSRDNIRFSILKDNEDYFSHETEVYNKFIEEIKDGLIYCDTTIADATHLNEVSRNKIFKSLGNTTKNIKVIAIIIDTPLSQSLKQNKMREGREFVPESAIRRMSSSMTIPTIEEGFDEIYIYKNNEYKIIIKEDK